MPDDCDTLAAREAADDFIASANEALNLAIKEKRLFAIASRDCLDRRILELTIVSATSET